MASRDGARPLAPLALLALVGLAGAAGAAAAAASPRLLVLCLLAAIAPAWVVWWALAAPAAAAMTTPEAVPGALASQAGAALELEARLEHAPVALFQVDPAGGAEPVAPLNASARQLLAPGRVADRAALFDLLAARALQERGRALVAFDTEGGSERAMLAVSSLTVQGASRRIVALLPVESELESETLAAWRQLVQVLTHEIMNSLTPVASLSNTAQGLLRELQPHLPEEARRSVAADTGAGAQLHPVAHADAIMYAAGDANAAITANTVIAACADRNAHAVAANADLAADADALAVVADLDAALDAIARRAASLADFVGSYRSLSALPPARPERIELAPLFARLATLLGADWRARGGVLRFEVEPGSLALVADPGQLEQALINLLKNAAEATAGQAVPSASVQARLVRGGRLRIDVGDNGPGVPQDVLPHIFTPFYTTKKGGRGIGLALVRQLVHGNGGTVRHVRPVAGGARFVLSF